MERLLRFISHRPWTVLAMLVALTALAASQLVDVAPAGLRLEIDPSTNALLPEDSEDRTFYEFVRKLFGSDENMIVALSADDVFTRENLARVKRLTERLAEVEGVHHVTSLTNAPNVRGTAEGLDIRPFVTEVPEDPEELARIRREALESPIYAGTLVSRDGRATAVIVYFMNFPDRDYIEKDIVNRIIAIAHEEAGNAEIWVTGGPRIKVAQYEYQNSDLWRSLPLILVASAVVLGFSFRTLRGVVLPLLTVTLALIWAMGITAWIGRPLTMVTILVPPLVVILGLSYCVHVVSEYYERLREEPDAPNREVTREALRLVSGPVALTGLTTAAGFVAIMLNPIGAIREFGLLAVIGVAAAVVAALTVPAAGMGILGRPRRAPRSPEGGGGDHFSRFARRAAAFNLGNRRAIYIASGAIFVISILAVTQLQVGAEGIRTFPKHSEVRRDFEGVNEHLEGANLFNVVIQSEAERAFQDPEKLRVLEDFQGWLQAQPEIGGTTSLVQYLKLCNRAFHEDDPAHLAIPESRRRTAQLLFFCSSDELESFVDAPYQIANVIVRANVVDTELVSALTRRIEARLEELAPDLEGRVTGNPILINRLFDQIVRGQAGSVLAAFVLIYGILLVMFVGSWRTALWALIPNTLPVAFYFGALGVSGVTLNFATSLIAPMALGIAIDDTIHYFWRFNQDAKSFADERRATASALKSVGRPVTYTTIAACVGFSMLVASDLRTFVQFGALGAATLAFAWVVDFTLTPALCSGLRIVTLWDTLRLDLGEDPQESIPIFRGLTKTQCRIAALMASVRRVPAGQPLIRIDERGDDMYVVIDGKLRVWVPGREGDINTHTRGDVVGEGGFFLGGKRGTNVDVTDDAVLLRFTPRNMDRLRRRHPRIAAAIFGNLNETQAERLAKQTARLIK